MFKPGIIQYTSSLSNGLLNNLISYYKCDINGTFTDSKGTNTGTINGATYNATGKINGGYDYNGTSGYVGLPTGMYDYSQSFTIAGWVKYDNISEITKVRWYEKSTNIYAGVLMTTGEGADASKPWFGVYDGVTFNYSKYPTALSNGVWYHMVGVFNRSTSTTTIYINSTAGTPATGVGTVTNGTFVHHLGRYFTQYFDGSIDEVGIWNRALSQTDITALYNSGNGLSFDNFTT